MNDNGTIYEQIDFTQPPTYQNREDTSTNKRWTLITFLAIITIIGSLGIPWMVENGVTPFVNVEHDEWIVIENDCEWLYGKNPMPRVVSEIGHRWRGLGKKVIRYPRIITFTYKDVSVTFNDTGVREINSVLVIDTPQDDKTKLDFHQGYVWSDGKLLTGQVHESLKRTGMIMSSREVTISRKAEYCQVVQEQIANGLYQMSRDANDYVHVDKDEINRPIVFQVSPLQQYGLNVRQFSITSIDISPAEYEKLKKRVHAKLMAAKAEAKEKIETQEKRLERAKMEKEIAEAEAQAAQGKAIVQRIIAEENIKAAKEAVAQKDSQPKEK